MSTAADAREARPGAPLALKLILPATQLGLGPVQIDPVARLFGKPVRELLGGLLAGEPERRATATGSLVEVYPLRIPHGQGVFLPLAELGELGLHHDDGLLVVTTPLIAGPLLKLKLGTAVVRGPENWPSSDRIRRVSRSWVRLRPGLRVAWPVGAIMGEVGVEVG